MAARNAGYRKENARRVFGGHSVHLSLVLGQNVERTSNGSPVELSSRNRWRQIPVTQDPRPL